MKKLGGGKVNLPYKMLQGMRTKSLDRFKEQKDMDKKLGILADTSRGDKKVMQGYFEQKHYEGAEAKRLNKDTERGMNMHLFSGAKFRDGALNLTKSGINTIEGRTFVKKGHASSEKLNKYLKPGEKPKRSYDEIVETRENNPEFMTGKRFRKKKGGVGKKFKGKKGKR